MEDVKKYIEKANVLVEALPYIKEFNNKIVVVKYGGSSMDDEELIKKVIDDIVLMKLVGMKPIIVHGGGPTINEMLNRLNIESKFINGLRVTDLDTIEVVEMVLTGKVNKNIVKLIQMHNIEAVGISGVDGKLIEAKKLEIPEGDIGYVGQITKVNAEVIESLLKDNFIPVIAPIGVDEKGNKYNINADYAAVAIAKEIKAEKLMFLTNVLGILRDVNDPLSLVSKMTINEARDLIKDGIICGGMIPKVECCIEAVHDGVKNVHIIDGTIEHSLILELLTKLGVGTLFYKEGEI